MSKFRGNCQMFAKVKAFPRKTKNKYANKYAYKYADKYITLGFKLNL